MRVGSSWRSTAHQDAGGRPRRNARYAAGGALDRAAVRMLMPRSARYAGAVDSVRLASACCLARSARAGPHDPGVRQVCRRWALRVVPWPHLQV